MEAIESREGAGSLQKAGKVTLSFPLIEIARDFPFYGIAQGSYVLAGLVGLAVYTRFLALEEYGFYVLTMTTVSVAELVGCGWINQALLRYYAEHKRRGTLSALFSHLIVLEGVSLFLLLGIWWAGISLADFLDPRLSRLLRIGGIVLLSRVAFNVAITLVRAERLTWRYSVYSAVASLGGVGLAWAFLDVFHSGADGLLYGVSVAMGVVCCSEFVRLRRIGGFRWSVVSAEYAKKWLGYGMPLIGASVGVLWLSWGDRYLLQYFLGPEKVGIYAAGYDLVDKSLRAAFSVLTATAFPVVLETVAGKESDIVQRMLARVLRLGVIVMIPLTVLVIAMKREMIALVLGPSFVEAHVVVPWIAVGSLCWGLSQVVSQELQIKERTPLLLFFLLIGTCVNLGLNVVLIPRFGIVGAAVSTTIAYLVYLSMCVAVSSHARWGLRSWLGSVLAKSAVAAIVMWSGMTLIPVRVSNRILAIAVRSIIGGCIYLGILLVAKEGTACGLARRLADLMRWGRRGGAFEARSDDS